MVKILKCLNCKKGDISQVGVRGLFMLLLKEVTKVILISILLTTYQEKYSTTEQKYFIRQMPSVYLVKAEWSEPPAMLQASLLWFAGTIKILLYTSNALYGVLCANLQPFKSIEELLLTSPIWSI